MTAQHVCRHCEEPITDPDDAVFLWHEEAASGPGWEAWAHRDHADLVEPDLVPLRILARLLIHRALNHPR
ncbi:hypothetical protein ACWDSD_43455 [Streptomyces spiralis]